MKKSTTALLALGLATTGVQAESSPDLQKLLEQMERLEQRDRERQQQIEALQRELQSTREGQAVQSEQIVRETETKPATPAAVARVPQRDPLDPESYRTRALSVSSGQVTSGTAFNPAMSVIVDGIAVAQSAAEI